MHEIAATVGSASVVLIGIIFGILYNQRGLDRVEARLDKIQADLNSFHRSLGQHDKAIEILEKRSAAN